REISASLRPLATAAVSDRRRRRWTAAPKQAAAPCQPAPTHDLLPPPCLPPPPKAFYMSMPLFALFLAAFGLGSGEFVIAGLLPDVSRDLGISIPDAGYLVTFYALGIAVGGPLTSLLVGRLDRKLALLLLVGAFTLGQALCALAPGFVALIAARIIVAFLHGAYFGVAAIVATNLVPPEKRGSAIAMLLAGITVANILGVPAGTAIGNAFGWRMTFWAVGALALVAFAAIALFVPRAPGGALAAPDLRSEFRVLSRQAVYLT